MRFHQTDVLKGELPIHILVIHKSHPDYASMSKEKLQIGTLTFDDGSIVPCLRKRHGKLREMQLTSFLHSRQADAEQMEYLKSAMFPRIRATYDY